MDVLKHFGFSKNHYPELYTYLVYNGIKVEQDDGHDIVGVDILYSHPCWCYIEDYLKRTNLPVFSECIFTKTELHSAEWLRVRSTWFVGYAEPSEGFAFRQTSYATDHFCEACGSGLVQTGVFQTQKTPKWGKRHFLHFYNVHGELFVSDTAKAILEKSDFSGLLFKDVYNKTGTAALPDIHQLYIPYILSGGFIEDPAILRAIKHCPQCGTTKYVGNGCGKNSYKREVFENAPDIVKTCELYGARKSAERLILLRQNVYRTLVDNHLDRALIFEPVDLI